MIDRKDVSDFIQRNIGKRAEVQDCIFHVYNPVKSPFKRIRHLFQEMPYMSYFNLSIIPPRPPSFPATSPDIDFLLDTSCDFLDFLIGEVNADNAFNSLNGV